MQVLDWIGLLALGIAMQGLGLTKAFAGVSPENPAMQSPAEGMLTVEGTVAYRQRMAMPPTAVLQVQLADVSRMDAPATVLAESREEFAGRQVPLRFALQLPKSAIDERRRYAVNARILIDGRLAFISTDAHGVLTFGQGNQVDLMLQAVGAVAANSTATAQPEPVLATSTTQPSPVPSLAFLTLPASFSGILPCADCAGIAQTLTLRADGLYRMRSVYLGKDSPPLSEQGRWMAEAGSNKLVLQAAATQQIWALSHRKQDKSGAAASLRLLDLTGKAIHSKLNYELRRTTQVDEISEPLNWQGELVVRSETVRFTDCISGLSWPLTTGGDWVNLQRSYGQFAKAPGAPVLVKLQGRLLKAPGLGGKVQEQLNVDKFVAAETSGARCEALKPEAKKQGMASKSDAAAPKVGLTETYWKLVELDGQKVRSPAAQQREVQITLHKQNNRLSGSSGCNRLMGSFKQDGTSGLSFSRVAGSMMACSAEAMVMEKKVLSLLAQTTAFSIDGERLTLRAGNSVLARFESVYFH